LGAFAKAQEEGGRVFSKLVKEGTDLQKRTQKLAENKASGVTETVTKMVDDVSKQASGSWDKLEQIFEDRVVRALSSIGVPTRSDVDILTRRIEQLSNAVAQLTGKSVSGTPKVDDGPKAPVNGAANGVMKKPVIRKSALKVASKVSEPASEAASKAMLKPAAKSISEPASKEAIEIALKAVKAVKTPSAAAKTVTKPEVKPDVKPEVKLEVKSEVKATAKPAIKSALKPVSKAAPNVRVVAKPVAKAIAGSGFPTTESVCCGLIYPDTSIGGKYTT
jgi:poly(hydroxyalkanoate) granule-associated protein